MAVLADTTTIWADIVGVLILAIIAFAIYIVISLLFLPKRTTARSHRLEEEERRRSQEHEQKGRRVA